MPNVLLDADAWERQKAENGQTLEVSNWYRDKNTELTEEGKKTSLQKCQVDKIIQSKHCSGKTPTLGKN